MNSVDGPPRYSILNYQRTGNGSYHWVVVGNYTRKLTKFSRCRRVVRYEQRSRLMCAHVPGHRSENEEGRPELRLNRENLRFRGEPIGQFPASSCSRPCGSNRIMVRSKEDPCCWRCQSCGFYRYKVAEEQRCDDCQPGTLPSQNGTSCEPIPEQFVDRSNPWAIVAMAVAISGTPSVASAFPSLLADPIVTDPGLLAGMLLVAFVCAVFWTHRQTPMIKAPGRELSFLLLLGAFGCFSMTFAVVARPSVQSCAIVRFGIGFCYTVCYAALATKINRIHRIFNQPGRSPRKRR